MDEKDKRLGFVGIMIEHDENNVVEVQKILSGCAPVIMGRMGLPHLKDDTVSVITLIVNATTDEIGAMTGKLGRIKGVSVKSGLCKV
jgi:putative iron-only hydrogenase system regulator